MGKLNIYTYKRTTQERAKRDLEDKDSWMKDPSTRAYKDGKKRYARFSK